MRLVSGSGVVTFCLLLPLVGSGASMGPRSIVSRPLLDSPSNSGSNPPGPFTNSSAPLVIPSARLLYRPVSVEYSTGEGCSRVNNRNPYCHSFFELFVFFGGWETFWVRQKPLPSATAGNSKAPNYVIAQESAVVLG